MQRPPSISVGGAGFELPFPHALGLLERPAGFGKGFSVRFSAQLADGLLKGNWRARDRTRLWYRFLLTTYQGNNCHKWDILLHRSLLNSDLLR